MTLKALKAATGGQPIEKLIDRQAVLSEAEGIFRY